MADPENGGNFIPEEPEVIVREKSKTIDFRREGGEEVDSLVDQLFQVEKEKQLEEFAEWRDGEFKNNMRMVVKEQQEICSGNQEACLDGVGMYEKMFRESWSGGEPQAQTAA